MIQNFGCNFHYYGKVNDSGRKINKLRTFDNSSNYFFNFDICLLISNCFLISAISINKPNVRKTYHFNKYVKFYIRKSKTILFNSEKWEIDKKSTSSL